MAKNLNKALMKIIMLRVTERMKLQLDAEAADHGMATTEFIRHVLFNYFKEREEKYAGLTRHLG